MDYNTNLKNFILSQSNFNIDQIKQKIIGNLGGYYLVINQLTTVKTVIQS